jgi:hypothetical protein
MSASKETLGGPADRGGGDGDAQSKKAHVPSDLNQPLLQCTPITELLNQCHYDDK